LLLAGTVCKFARLNQEFTLLWALFFSLVVAAQPCAGFESLIITDKIDTTL
jgi:hypothetical protein